MTDLLSVQTLPVPIVQWFHAYLADETSVQARIVESNGFRVVIQLSVDGADGITDTSMGRVYTDDEGRHLYIYTTRPEEDESLYSAKDYIDSAARVARHLAELEGSVKLAERLNVHLWLWRVLCAMAFLGALTR